MPRFLTPENEADISAIAQGILDADGSCHDWDHTLRVKNTALKLGTQEGADLEIVGNRHI